MIADKFALPGGVLLAMLAILVGIAGWSDVFRRKIPNWICAIVAVLGPVYVGSTQGWQHAGLAIAHAILALIVVMGLFAIHFIGAGDAKFYAAIAAWLPVQQGLPLLVTVALSGLVLLVAFLALRLPGRATRSRVDRSDFDKLPYGVAIGLGGLIAVALA